ncbi:hypothetical protein ACP26L_01955 [Paenibacillus sp. S-38]|uniref:hypothetical protein n=1 Tax=Paenibacillus sp. S-38 TaxID=3416710 RepID=UPI003CF09C25
MPEEKGSRRTGEAAESAGERPFSESREFGHERNPVAAAQKQMASQETAGVLDES